MLYTYLSPQSPQLLKTLASPSQGANPNLIYINSTLLLTPGCHKTTTQKSLLSLNQKSHAMHGNPGHVQVKFKRKAASLIGQGTGHIDRIPFMD